MSFDTLLYNLDLSKHVKEHIENCLKGNAYDSFEEACVVRIYSGNPFRISDNSYYIDVKDPSVIISRLKAVNKNVNWNTMPGILIRLKKWKIVSDYDEDHDRLKFDLLIDDADYLEKTELSHQELADITPIQEAAEFRNKFQMLKKYYMAERFDQQHPIENAIEMLEIAKNGDDFADPDGLKPFMASSLNKFPSTFSFTDQYNGREGEEEEEEEEIVYSKSPNKFETKRNYIQTVDLESQDDYRLGEYLIKMDGEAEKKESIKKESLKKESLRKESLRKRSEYAKRLKHRLESISSSRKPTPFKVSPLKSNPLGIVKISNAQFKEVMRAGPTTVLNKRTPQPEDLEEELYFDVSGEEVEPEQPEPEEDESAYFNSFKLVRVNPLREKPKSVKKSSTVKFAKASTDKKIFHRFTDDDEELGVGFKHPKDLFRSQVQSLGKKKTKMNLSEYKPVNWKLSSSSGFY